MPRTSLVSRAFSTRHWCSYAPPRKFLGAAPEMYQFGSVCLCKHDRQTRFECNSEKTYATLVDDDELKDDIQQTLFVSSTTNIRIFL